MAGLPIRYAYDWHRILSGTWAVLWLGASALQAGLVGALEGGLLILVPMTCIWFPEAMGSYATALVGPITRRSPGPAVRVAGWVLLLLLTVVAPIIIATTE